MTDSTRPTLGTLKIVQFTAENVKRLKAVEITPDGNLVQITGRNAQGKTSILDAIWLALEYKTAARQIGRPVRDGEDQGMVRLDLGSIIVTRTMKPGEDGKVTTALTVETKNGTPLQRPQEVLDELVGKLSFDPLAFANMSDKEQVATLLGLVDLDFDPVELDTERQRIYDTRALKGQEVAKAKGAFQSLPMPDLDVPDTEVSLSDLAAEYDHRMGTMASNNAIRGRVTTAQQRVDQLKAELERAEGELAEATAALANMPEDPDLDEIKGRMAEVEATNAAIREARDYRAAKAKWDALQGEWDAYTEQINEIDQTKADGLARAQFPVNGLGFADGGVTFKGLPFKDASGAQKLKVSMAIAMAMNPDLRVIRIKDGSLLDADNLAVIERLAGQNDFQVWIERVATDQPVGVVIEDGKVVK